MKKNVLVIQRGYTLGLNTGDKVRTLNMVRSLCDMGYNVILLAFYTKRFHLLQEEKKNHPTDYTSLFKFSLPNRFGLSKIAEYFRAKITSHICRKYKIDIIQAEVSFTATCARFVPNIPLITDFHADLVPELEMAGFPQSAIQHATNENVFALKHSKKIITVSANLYNNLLVYGRTNVSNFILPTNFQPEPFLQLNSSIREDMRKQYGLTDKIVLCYSGGLHVWQCIRETLTLVIQLRKLNPRYYICLFTNDDVTPYRSLMDELDGNYLVKGLKSTEMPEYLSMIDVGFVLRVDSLVNINSSPTKTSEYMAVGAMIIATQYAGDAPQLIRESSCGVVLDDISPLSDNQLMALDKEIIDYVENYKSKAEKAKNYVFKNRIWASNEEKLRQLYNELENEMN